MVKIKARTSKTLYVYPEDIIRVWVFVSFWISPFAVWKICELVKPYFNG